MSTLTDAQSTVDTKARYQGRLRNTLLLALLPVSVILILLMGGISYLRARSVIEGQVNSQLDANLDLLASGLDQWLRTKSIRLDIAVRKPAFESTLDKIISSISAGENIAVPRQIILTELEAIASRGEELLFSSFFITLPDGQIITSSRQIWEKTNIADTNYFQTLFSQSASMVVNNPAPLIDNDTVVFTSIPIFDSQNALKATVFGLSGSLSMIGFLEDATLFSPDAQSYIITDSDQFIWIDPYRMILTDQLPSDDQVRQLLPLKDTSIFGVSEDPYNNVSIDTFDGSTAISSFTWLPSLRGGLVLELPQDVAFGELNTLGFITLGIAAILGALIAGVIVVVTQRLVGPLRSLTQTTELFSQGIWDERAPDTRNDEIGLLSHTFNVMADDLSGIYRSLEAQVQERTESLEERSQQLQATAEVARAASAIRSLDELLVSSTELISQHFGYYHTGIFLLDDARRFAVLQASNSEGGERMLERSHRLEIGQVGVVGYVAETGLPRIALDVGEDAIFFENPDLPETRSEIALPLSIRDRVIGVLDVQSREPGAFKESDVDVLQVLADQIALAIENARLLEQSQEALEELEHAYGEQTRKGWMEKLKTETSAFYFDRVKLAPVPSEQIKSNKIFTSTQPTIKNSQDGSTLIVPITLRGQKLGTIVLRRDSGLTPWESKDLTLVQESVNQISIALDNARLLDDSRRRSEHEQTVSGISSQLSRSFDVESILKTAVRELGQLPNVVDASVHVRAPKTN